MGWWVIRSSTAAHRHAHGATYIHLMFGLRTGASRSADLRPNDADIDMAGLTHPGNVRKDNQDHFMIETIHPETRVHASSLPAEELPLRGARLGTMLLVADGVGGTED